jgi:hypothetical protein
VIRSPRMHGWPERLPGSIMMRDVTLREYHRAQSGSAGESISRPALRNFRRRTLATQLAGGARVPNLKDQISGILVNISKRCRQRHFAITTELSNGPTAQMPL